MLRLTLAALLLAGIGCSKQTTLEQRLKQIESRVAPARLGVAIFDFQTSKHTGLHSDEQFPMQSVFKAPLAAAIFSLADEAKLSLDQKVTLQARDLSAPTGFPESINEQWPKRREYTILELIEKAVTISDNSAADFLLQLIGGPDALNRYLEKHGIHGIHLDRYERQLQTEVCGMGTFQVSWANDKQFTLARLTVPESVRRRSMENYLSDARDTTTPQAAVMFLRKLEMGELLSTARTRQLLSLMSLNNGRPRRLLGAGIPIDATIAHKAGATDEDLGICPALNDIGIVTLNDGRKFAIASFLAGTTLSTLQREAIHADVAKAVFSEESHPSNSHN